MDTVAADVLSRGEGNMLRVDEEEGEMVAAEFKRGLTELEPARGPLAVARSGVTTGEGC